jgi:hypothetical protein
MSSYFDKRASTSSSSSFALYDVPYTRLSTKYEEPKIHQSHRASGEDKDKMKGFEVCINIIRAYYLSVVYTYATTHTTHTTHTHTTSHAHTPTPTHAHARPRMPTHAHARPTHAHVRAPLLSSTYNIVIRLLKFIIRALISTYQIIEYIVIGSLLPRQKYRRKGEKSIYSFNLYL